MATSRGWVTVIRADSSSMLTCSPSKMPKPSTGQTARSGTPNGMTPRLTDGSGHGRFAVVGDLPEGGDRAQQGGRVSGCLEHSGYDQRLVHPEGSGALVQREVGLLEPAQSAGLQAS